ncbi:hypothetical protein Ae706Ps2_6276c [Pseudonocardia sp. Ae706_Ps2]|nr:hypothetical protein Ae263Ps1_6240 [Pseudonocardia sp. Ae263_Ps1]OLL89789.1 hypothetical protein Ae331Ps2_6125c [Pseudonocardia sp. Ae331_Ps2]OLM09734.1 hypothetical protein Ae706Ps2_6196c [Pseudonocardia sp. Ae706_Ps2]OLM09781.1 hypothetical protein Ae706Ps2_6243c [Pseudonocardia sp. Ae706_Ps2]OLM09814.1 hypothetical protein Ae706Ps2_6276c [Pseudonocardia sp. Ae706_Ps2]
MIARMTCGKSIHTRTSAVSERLSLGVVNQDEKRSLVPAPTRTGGSTPAP